MSRRSSLPWLRRIALKNYLTEDFAEIWIAKLLNDLIRFGVVPHRNYEARVSHLWFTVGERSEVLSNPSSNWLLQGV